MSSQKSKEDVLKIPGRADALVLQMFFKIGVHKNFANFTGKHLCWSLFLKKLQALSKFPVTF